MQEKAGKKKHHTGLVLWIILLIINIGLNAAAWNSSRFCDWYVDEVYPYLSSALGWLTSLAPISIGERLLLAAALWLIVLALITLLWLLRFLFTRRRRNSVGYLKRTAFTGCFWKLTLWVANIVLLIMTLNCTILYHVTPLENALPGYGKEYDAAALADLRDLVVNRVNTLAEEMPRDSDGSILYGRYAHDAAAAKQDGQLVSYTNSGIGVTAFNRNTEIDMEAGARAAVSRLGRHGYPLLSSRNCPGRSEDGQITLVPFQPRPKHLSLSGFVSQQNMEGYYFPFTMEANYNELMENMNKPFTMCHELSHTHGYIFEDDANFLAWLACVESGDPVFEYSGWLGILNYVNNSYYASVPREEYDSHPAIHAQVWTDATFVREDIMQKIEASSPLESETVHQSTDTYLDTTLKANGVSEGKAQYDHVTQLLLEYFDGNYDNIAF